MWFKVDDGFHSSKKLLMIPRKHRLEAAGLWVIAGSWCGNHLTDGLVPDYMIDEWGGTPELVEWLVRVGLWEHVADNSTQFTKWEEYQPTKAEVESKRTFERERKRKQRRGENGRFEADAECPTGTPTGTPAGVTPESHRPDPTRPDHKRTPSSPATPPMEFDQFWAAYPRRVGKQAAIKAWTKAVKITEPRKIIDAAASYARTVRDKDPQYTAHPSSWLNAGRWDDEPLFNTPAFDPWASEGVHA